VVYGWQTLFTGTVAENIAYGDMSEALDMEKIKEAGRMANVDDFIKHLPHGYNTHLGDRATTLSGGQRQRYFSLSSVDFLSVRFASSPAFKIFSPTTYRFSIIWVSLRLSIVEGDVEG